MGLEQPFTPDGLIRAGYELLRPLGEGATAEVFVAYQASSGSEVALKLSRGDHADSIPVANRLETAFNVARSLHNPHFVKAYEGGRLDDGRAWMAMELLIGHDLETQLRTKGRLPPEAACHVARQIFEGLLTLHRMGVIHRDVKPENIFLQATADGHISVKLIDLGLVSLGGQDPKRRHAETGPVIMGTPLYLAPELAQGARPSAASDCYSVGAVLFHMLTGDPPFPGDDPVAVMERHIDEPPPQLPHALPGVLRSLVARCLHKLPELRLSDAQRAIALIDQALPELASAPTTPDAIMPAIPPLGDVAEWHRFADALVRQITRWWPDAHRPIDVQSSIGRMQSTRGRLGQAEHEAFTRRNRLESRTAARADDQDRISARMIEVEQVLEVAIFARNGLLDDVTDFIKNRDRIDGQYDTALDALRRGLPYMDLDAASSVEIQPVAHAIEELLFQRDESEQVIGRARERVLASEEHVAMLLAERLELQRTLGDLLLDEQDHGRRLALMAEISQDAEFAAQRGFEEACLKVYQALVRHSESTR